MSTAPLLNFLLRSLFLSERRLFSCWSDDICRRSNATCRDAGGSCSDTSSEEDEGSGSAMASRRRGRKVCGGLLGATLGACSEASALSEVSSCSCPEERRGGHWRRDLLRGLAGNPRWRDSRNVSARAAPCLVMRGRIGRDGKALSCLGMLTVGEHACSHEASPRYLGWFIYISIWGWHRPDSAIVVTRRDGIRVLGEFHW